MLHRYLISILIIILAIVIIRKNNNNGIKVTFSILSGFLITGIILSLYSEIKRIHPFDLFYRYNVFTGEISYLPIYTLKNGLFFVSITVLISIGVYYLSNYKRAEQIEQRKEI